MTIQRYNQGFGGFGPLEKCSDGKLVKYEDHENEIIRIDDYKNGWKKRAIISERDSFEKDDEISEIKQKIKKLKVDVIVLAVLVAFSVTLLIIK